MYVFLCLCMHLGMHVPHACRYLPRTEEAVKYSGAGGESCDLFYVGASVYRSSQINGSSISSVYNAKGKEGCKLQSPFL